MNTNTDVNTNEELTLEELQRFRFDNDVWTTTNNKALHLEEMHTRHIRNAIAKIKRGEHCCGMEQEWLLKLQEELESRKK